MGDTTGVLGGWRGLVGTALDSLAKDNHLIISVESDEPGATNPLRPLMCCQELPPDRDWELC